jgi:hypothetical protein
MSTQRINLNISITWARLKNGDNKPYKWGDRKDSTIDPNWTKSNVIYRWVKNSTGEIAEIGETERRLTERINNYISASPNSSAGATNKKVYNEQQRLSQNKDYLFLEFTDSVPGYNLNNDRERKFAESLLVGYTKPYLQ